MAALKAKKTTSSYSNIKIAKPKKKRKGIHAKTKTSKSKQSKNYIKISRGQG